MRYKSNALFPTLLATSSEWQFSNLPSSSWWPLIPNLTFPSTSVYLIPLVTFFYEISAVAISEQILCCHRRPTECLKLETWFYMHLTLLIFELFNRLFPIVESCTAKCIFSSFIATYKFQSTSFAAEKNNYIVSRGAVMKPIKWCIP